MLLRLLYKYICKCRNRCPGYRPKMKDLFSRHGQCQFLTCSDVTCVGLCIGSPYLAAGSEFLPISRLLSPASIVFTASLISVREVVAQIFNRDRGNADNPLPHDTEWYPWRIRSAAANLEHKQAAIFPLKRLASRFRICSASFTWILIDVTEDFAKFLSFHRSKPLS